MKWDLDNYIPDKILKWLHEILKKNFYSTDVFYIHEYKNSFIKCPGNHFNNLNLH